MFVRLGLSVLAVLSLSALAGCASDGVAEGSGTDEADATAAKHAKAAKACKTAFEEGADRIDSQQTSELEALAARARECYRKANDGAVARIEKRLKAAKVDEQGTTKAKFAAYRANAEALCAQSTSDVLGAPLCLASYEGSLSDLIDAHADLGVAVTPIERRPEGEYVRCYDAFEQSAAGHAEDSEEGLDAAMTLTACTSAMLQLEVADDQELGGTVQDAFDANVDVCTVLTGGGSDASWESEMCTADSILLLQQAIETFR